MRERAVTVVPYYVTPKGKMFAVASRATRKRRLQPAAHTRRILASMQNSSLAASRRTRLLPINIQTSCMAWLPDQ